MTPRALLLAGHVHLGLAAFAGAGRAGGLPVPLFADLLLASAGLVLVAAGLAHGYAGPFLKRVIPVPGLAWGMLALVLVGDALLFDVAWAARAFGLAFLVLPLHLAATAAWGREWRGGVALFAKDQPFRRGDLIAAVTFGISLVGLAAAGLLLAFLVRGIPTPGLAVLLLGFALPFFAGMLLFLLPRNAKTPLPGATLVGAALALSASSTLALGIAFAQPASADFRWPAAGALLADVLLLAALSRLRFPEPGPQMRRALPLVRAAGALAVLAGIALALATAGGLPGSLLPVAAYAHVLLAATLATAATLLGAPILVNSVPREGRWAAAASGLAIAGLFLLAPSFQYDRPPVVGAILIVAASLLALWGLAPLRTPRREC